jgi:hypothetical protein
LAGQIRSGFKVEHEAWPGRGAGPLGNVVPHDHDSLPRLLRKAVAEVVSKQLGKTISATYVSNIKSLMKKGKGSGKKRYEETGRNSF